jgi:alpha-tubulin suppressor-like RCC1 family protein
MVKPMQHSTLALLLSLSACTTESAVGGDRADGGVADSAPVDTAVVDAETAGSALSLDVAGTASCAIQSDGHLWCWGYKDLSVLPGGESQTAPFDRGVFPGVLSFRGGFSVFCAITTEHRAKCWGNTIFGRAFSPVILEALSDVADIAFSTSEGCALHLDGTVSCWRSGLGPTKVAGVAGAKAISGNDINFCALLADATVKCWGGNPGRSLIPTSTAEEITTALPIEGLTDVVEVRGYGAWCALRKDGTVMCWGPNTYGELGDGTKDNRDGVLVKAKVSGAAALGGALKSPCAALSSGETWCWGEQFTNSDLGIAPAKLPGLGPVQSFARNTTANHTCARLRDGTVWCWGWNADGNLGRGMYGALRGDPAPVKF